MKGGDVRLALKALKRSVKLVPELGRTAFGAVLPRKTDGLLPIGVDVPGDFRDFGGTTKGKITVVTPKCGHFMTTFFDVDPLSPSRRFLLVTQLPFIWRMPYPGDEARVVVIDLHTGTARAVAKTFGWGTQLGANAQWGSDDNTVFFNDLTPSGPKGVRLNLVTMQSVQLGGPVYGLNRERNVSFSAAIDLINAGIPGYGVPEKFLGRKRQIENESETEGIWRTDLESGHSSLFLSIKDIVSKLPDQVELNGGKYYVFNVKINSVGSHGFAVLFSKQVPSRWGWPLQLVVFDLESREVRLAVPDSVWRHGGHHPNWTPDGTHILMNLRRPGGQMEFVRIPKEGNEIEVVARGVKGGGHPSMNTRQTHILTDAYVSENLHNSKGHVPLRLIHVQQRNEEVLAWIDTRRLEGPRRIDPHPVWTDGDRRVVFNGIVDGNRQVMIADTAGMV